MKVIVYGATGMVGQGVLRECLLDPGVEQVLTVGRSATGQSSDKLRELVRRDLFDYAGLGPELTGYDACFFCLGVSSVGMSEADYTRVTYDLALAAATTLARLNPRMTFVFVSGMGADSTEKGRTMWARVKGRTENALLRLPFRAVYVVRPGFIQPLHGITSRTRLYRLLYPLLRPLVPLLRRFSPEGVISTEELGRAMLLLARTGAPKHLLEMKDLRALLQANG